MVTGGKVIGEMDKIGDGTFDEPWVIYGSVEYLYCTPKPNIT